MTKEQLLREIDKATDPHEMTPQEALEWLEDLAAEIEGRIAGLQDDMEG